jgi:hypothetical protein
LLSSAIPFDQAAQPLSLPHLGIAYELFGKQEEVTALPTGRFRMKIKRPVLSLHGSSTTRAAKRQRSVMNSVSFAVLGHFDSGPFNDPIENQYGRTKRFTDERSHLLERYLSEVTGSVKPLVEQNSEALNQPWWRR